jgi:hypothetical protein
LVFAASFHTFPIDAGLFGLRHNTYFTGFVSFALLAVTYLTVNRERTPFLNEIIAGSLAVSVVVAVGLASSYLKMDPSILKLHLHRLNSVFLLVAAPVVIHGLYKDFRAGGLLVSIVAGAALAMPFILDHGIALVPSVLLAMVHCIQAFHRRSFVEGYVISLALATILFIYGMYWSLGYLRGLREPMYGGFGGNALGIACTMIVIAAVLVSAALSRKELKVEVLIVILGVLAVALQLKSWPLAGAVDKSKDFLEVQLWAKDNTPPKTLFFVDPTHSYGWRGFSERPTMGSVREWLYTSALYTVDEKSVTLGKQLFADFGLDLAKYLSGKEPLDGYYYALLKLRQTFCKIGNERLLSLGKKYGASLFVFDKANCESAPDIKIVFENSSFYVGRITQ